MATRSALPSQKPTRIVIAGDWHGDTDHATSVVRWAHRHGADGILQLGDFGIWAGKAGSDYIKALNRQLARSGLWLGFVDGNHENFDLLEAMPVRRGVRPITQCITHLPRGYRWTWGQRTWLTLGGAVSLDAKWRRPLIDWWEQEEITNAQASEVMEFGPVNYMLTHDAPATVEVPGLTTDWPEEALTAANAHRDLLAAVTDVVQPSYLFHGHMHVRYGGELKHPGGLCYVEGLASNIEPFMHNVLLVDLDPDGNLVLPRRGVDDRSWVGR